MFYFFPLRPIGWAATDNTRDEGFPGCGLLGGQADLLSFFGTRDKLNRVTQLRTVVYLFALAVDRAFESMWQEGKLGLLTDVMPVLLLGSQKPVLAVPGCGRPSWQAMHLGRGPEWRGKEKAALLFLRLPASRVFLSWGGQLACLLGK